MSKSFITNDRIYTIYSLSHDGRGITEHEGKKVFVHGALPGETVQLQFYKRKRHFLEARALAIIKESSDRTKPPCIYFGRCGGCQLQHASSQAQLVFKQQIFLEQLKHFGHTEPLSLLPPLQAKTWHYRHKARLGVKYIIKQDRLVVGFRELANPRYITGISTCEILHESVSQLLPKLTHVLNLLSIKRDIPQVEVAVSDININLIIRHLKPLTENDLKLLNNFMLEEKIELYLQSGDLSTCHPLSTLSQSPIYHLPNHISITYAPYDFTQNNFSLNAKMVELALELLALTSHDYILDLFCGLGNFTFPIAKLAKEVVGIEIDEHMVTQAKINATRNQINNAHFRAINLYEDTTSWSQPIYQKILLDPPRSGAKLLIPSLVHINPEKIVYVSCHPATFARDVGDLISKGGYKLSKAGIMDMFPHTSHFEVIGLLEK